MPTTYRYELAKTNRSQCQVAACKAKGDKIAKGELRFGSLVTIQEHDTWKWKHWGCVTPAQIATILEQIGGLEGLDIDKDLDILDGYDELPDWAQDKIKYALTHGHVNNDDWKGDPELNVPGAKGLRKRTPKKKAKKDVDNDEQNNDDLETSPAPQAIKGGRTKVVKDEDEEVEQPKKKASRKRKAAPVKDEDEVEAEAEEPEPEPKPKRSTKKAKTNVKDEDGDERLTEDAPKPADKRGKKSGGKASGGVAQVDGGNDEPANDKIQSKTSQGRRSKKIKNDSDIEDAPEPATRPRKSRGKKVKEPEVNESDSDTEAETTEAAKPSKSRNTKKAKATPAVDAEFDQAEADEEPVSKPTRGRGRPKKKL